MKYLLEHLQQFAVTNPLCDTAEDCGLPDVQASESTLNNVLDTVFFAAGALAVVFIIVGGFQYVTSAGNPDKAKKAWQTMLYAFIGLIVAISAFAITNFVIGKVPQ